MRARFDGRVGAFVSMLFILLYFPCASTAGAIFRETARRWTALSVLGSTGATYGAAVGFYQIVTLARHPLPSSLWRGGLMLTLVAASYTLFHSGHRKNQIAASVNFT